MTKFQLSPKEHSYIVYAWGESRLCDRAYVVFDGQFGSTGKAMASALLAGVLEVQQSVTNAGPNSGRRIRLGELVLKCRQIPIAPFASRHVEQVYLSAGACIDPDLLVEEIERLHEHRETMGWDPVKVSVHPNCVIITTDDLGRNEDVSSTGTGSGPATIRKMERKPGLSTLIGAMHPACGWLRHVEQKRLWPSVRSIRQTLLEVPQGMDLSIDGPFYPYTTHRNCTPIQAMSDAGMPSNQDHKVLACFRTLPIRTGSLPGVTSGDCWPDQREMGWEERGLKPEKATVTGRTRRLFSWSWFQYEHCLLHTRPDALFLNFCNYLPRAEWEKLLDKMIDRYVQCLGRLPDFVMTGHSDQVEDLEVWKV